MSAASTPATRALSVASIALVVAGCFGCGTTQPKSGGPSAASPRVAEEVTFSSGGLTLRGALYKPIGTGPFPAVLFNHGSAPGMLNSQAFEAMGPLFAARGWVFFAPYRRGQGLSASAGPYIGDQIEAARKTGGTSAGSAEMVRLLEGDHLEDQLAALAWLRAASFVRPGRIATVGNSFGGIETVLGVERASYCAGVDASGGAQSWAASPGLQASMTRAVRNARAPLFFFQAENDFDVSPTRVLASVMKDAGKQCEAKIYPRFGKSSHDGHSFAYRGTAIWFDDVLRFLERHCAP
jgi:carboxymethylenebutenolidase